MQQVTGIILAGGVSRRMGTEKALLPLPGNKQLTFVEYLASLLAEQCCEVLLVARDEAQAARYGKVAGVRILVDKIPDRGPLMGLYSGLSAMDAAVSSHALVMAVDMPLVQPALVAFLLAQPRSDALMVPVVNGVPQVLCAIYPHSVLPLVEQRLQEGRRDPRSLLEVAPVSYIEEAQLREVDPQLRSFVNVNTPEELDGLT
ncbi:MAG: molybdenum cofactor guanylyltransferase [Ktedonobacteraceae bacterium]